MHTQTSLGHEPENRWATQLTIAIPTYNRNQTLLRNLKLLLPQLTPQCRLLILDNCSPVPVEETLNELLKEHSHVNFQIVRHPTNIGGNANILRCIELCQTPWLWILGDDDAPLPSAISHIFEEIEAHSHCAAINFSIDKKRERSWTTRGVDELAQTLDGSADLPWISNSVYRAADFKANLKFGYQYIYSMLPHVAVLLVTMGQSGACHLSQAMIVDSDTRDVDEKPEEQWSSVNLALGFPILFDLPLRPRVRELLRHKLLRTNRRGVPSLHGVFFQLLLQGIKERDHRDVVYYFDQICGRQSPRNQGFKRRFQLAVYRLILRFPLGTARAFRLLRGRKIGDANFQDRFDRM